IEQVDDATRTHREGAEVEHAIALGEAVVDHRAQGVATDAGIGVTREEANSRSVVVGIERRHRFAHAADALAVGGTHAHAEVSTGLGSPRRPEIAAALLSNADR